ncbi:hypothetical protein BaRGS_00027957, partial [Batillaria attramentaria]
LQAADNKDSPKSKRITFQEWETDELAERDRQQHLQVNANDSSSAVPGRRIGRLLPPSPLPPSCSPLPGDFYPRAASPLPSACGPGGYGVQLVLDVGRSPTDPRCYILQ